MPEHDDVTQRGGEDAGTSVLDAAPAAAAATARQAARAGQKGRKLGSREAWILTVCCVAQFMVILDLSIVNVALPNIQSSLEFTSPELQWVVDAYAITFAGFLMLAGRVADYFGQRKTIVAALLMFALASLAGGIAPTKDILVGARALQGLAGAFMAASSLAIITASFPPGPKLHRAIGLWAAMNGLGGAAGVLLSGVITEFLSWRWVLLINPPIGVIAAFAAVAFVVDRRRSREGNFDLAGALLLTVGQMVLVFGVVEAGLLGWSAAAALGPILGGIALLVAFNFVEMRIASAPLIPFKDLTKGLNVANGVVVLFSAALFPMWFIGSLYLQQVLGLSPLSTGLTFLPMALMIMVVARSAGKLVTRFGVRAVLGSGLIMMTGGMLMFTRISPTGSPIIYVVLPGLLTAAGIGMSIVPSTIAATQGAKKGQAGLASGLVNTSRQVGGGLGLAVLITLATQRTTGLIGANHGVPQALTEGFQLAYLICAGLTAAAAIVTFTLLPRSAAAAQSSGARRAVPAVALTAVLACFVGVALAVGRPPGAPIGAYELSNTYSFVTEPSLHPPKLERYEAKGAKLAPGYIFTANFYDLSKPPMTGQSGPLMLDSSLQPVWFKPVPEKIVASNLSLQTYEGKPVLAWWQGIVSKTGATESGEYVVVNQRYETVARLKGVDGWKPTLHEIIIDGHDAWVTANKDIALNLSEWGGAYNGTLTDSAVQEYDLRTGRLIRNWDALKHLPLGDSHALIPTNGFPWDAYHINSIQLTGEGTFLVSMRDMWAAYLVNIDTGKVQWTLGGRKSDFKFGPSGAFSWQHDVRLRPGGVITMFDDHCCQIKSGGTYVEENVPSRALALKLDMSTHTAAMLAQYGEQAGLESDYMGNMQPLSNGNVFVGWGSKRYLSEYSHSGKLLFEGGFPGSDLSYRANLRQWVGTPLYPPKGAARQRSGKTTVYASWNGATEVASWRVLASTGSGPLSAVATKARSGFETAIATSGSYKRFEVQALDSSGKAIGASHEFTVGGAGR